MNHKQINDVLSGIDPRFISESLDQPIAKSSTARKPIRKFAIAAIAACLVLALSMTAYALNISGIRDLLGHTYHELPDEADQYIVPCSQIIEGEYWTCRVTESLTAGGTIMIALNVTCDEDYILNGCMDTPSNDEIEQGVGSFAYAEQQGKTPLYIAAVIHDGNADLSGYITSLDEIVSDREMNILIQRDKLTVDPISEAECIFEVREVRLENGVKVYDETDHTAFSVRLNEASVLESAVYVAADGSTIPGLNIENVTIDRTAVGNVVTLTASVTDEQAVDSVKLLRCDEIDEFFNFHNWIDNGKFFWRWTLAEIDDLDILTINAFSDPDSLPIGNIVLNKA